jgi:HD-GYP domain-containing protein (c-di-GMP phosphodiesterase class II)
MINIMEIIKILLVEPSESIGEVITKSLQRAFNADVIFHKTAAEGVERLKKGEVFSVILVRNQSDETPEIPSDQIAAQFLNIIYDLSLKTPLIVIGEFEHTFKKYALVSERLRIEEINRLVLKALGLKKEEFEHLKLPDYIAFPVKHFYLMTISPCNIYIKLVKKTGDEYVKRLNFSENFNKSDLQKYEELGLLDFYILKDEYEDFMNGLFHQTLNNLKKLRTLEENIEVVGDSFVLGTDLMRSLGINANCIAMVDQTILMMKNQIQKADKLGPLLKKLLDDKLSYSYRHSYLISALSFSLLPKMEWGSGDQQNILLEKICMVSYFHDIYLDDEKLIKISDLQEMKDAGLNPKDWDLLNNHANRAAVLVQSYPRLPQGVDLIIKQHHGVSNGVGFPLVLTAGISPMAIFFMVVEDFATNVLAMPDPPENLASSMKEAIKPLKEKYLLPSYRKIVTEIENLVNPKK